MSASLVGSEMCIRDRFKETLKGQKLPASEPCSDFTDMPCYKTLRQKNLEITIKDESSEKAEKARCKAGWAKFE
eukprot:11795971-Alexandrium_andersonii.AAC.1